MKTSLEQCMLHVFVYVRMYKNMTFHAYHVKGKNILSVQVHLEHENLAKVVVLAYLYKPTLKILHSYINRIA